MVSPHCPLRKWRILLRASRRSHAFVGWHRRSSSMCLIYRNTTVFTENPAIFHVSGSCVINGNSISTKVSSGLYFVLCSVKSAFCSVLLSALLFCSVLFSFAQCSSLLLCALPFCSGLFRFALCSSVLLCALLFALCSSLLLWALLFCSVLFHLLSLY